MRFAWIGFHSEGVPALEALLEAGAELAAVVTLREELLARRSGAADFAPLCAQYQVPLFRIADVNSPEAAQILASVAPDVVFVIGWHQIIRSEVLKLARVGMIGAHASLLPRNRGSAPVNWVLIRGERRTGNSLIWLAPDVDAGDVIDQVAFPITPYDTCASLYERVAETNRDMLLSLLPRLEAGERPGLRQSSGDEPVLPRRRPSDGLLDWNGSSRGVYDFVRALARPYPGAYSTLEGRTWKIWQAALMPAFDDGRTIPGTVLGPVVSPVPAACGQAVATGHGSVVLLELEAPDGTILTGRTLSEQRWSGKRWASV